MLTAQKTIKQKDSEQNCIPGEVFSLYVCFKTFPKNYAFLLITEKVPEIQKSRSYEMWALEILPS
jgi:hypothetical protein